MKPPKLWHVAGIGALGSLVAGRIHQGGDPVHLILKNQQQLTTYQTTGLSVTHLHNTYACKPKATDGEQLRQTLIDHLICCVKAYAVTPLLRRLQPNLSDNCLIILIHNGLGVLEEISAQWPSLRIISGVSMLGAYLDAPFSVRAFLEGPLYIGNSLGTVTPEEIARVCAIFQRANLPHRWEPHIQDLMWEKFALNCSINLLTVLFSCRNGGLLAHHDLLKTITREITEVLQAHGVAIEAEALLQKTIQLIQNTAENYSSTYMDVQQSRTTELEYLNQHLLRLAKQKQIKTPVTERLLTQFYATIPGSVDNSLT